ncbi:branched-chain amino acid ABC transporter permease [Geoglobus acetivorans]|uniref:High-affinity branched-chain amino acid transport system permease protein LivH n=1 Tax=Geoglobus acetivorans TaxID=565033 RepID=A0A0A7GGB7_GEOAI|nr:High-affinity branched-chain amino acid transport system permease protein LivH [Geoglobus acetivorans]
MSLLVNNAVIYANLLTLLAISLTITYITTSVPNFAQGSFAVFASYFAYLTYTIFNFPTPYFSIPFSIMFGALIGVSTYLLVLKPLIQKEASILILMIATLSWDLILLGLIGIFSESMSKMIMADASKFNFISLDFKLAGIKGILISSTLAVVFSLAFLFFLLYRTKFGVAMRASMENPSLAEIMGVNVETTRLFSWLLSGAFSGLAGALLPFLQETFQTTGQMIIVSIFAASIVGGLSTIYGAILGGYLVGLSESLVTFWLSKIFGMSVLVYTKAVSLTILILTLLFIPKGLTSVNWRRYIWRWKR